MEDKKVDTLEDRFLDKDNTHKISLLEKMLNRETFYWFRVPKNELIKYTDVKFTSYVIDGKYVGQLFHSYDIDKKVFMFCHLHYWICLDGHTAQELMNVVELFYNIEYEDGNKTVKYIKKNTDANIIQAIENEPSLQNVMKYYDQNDIGKALAELRKITEFSNEKNKEFKNFILSQSKDLQEMCKKVYEFITTYENHLAKNARASDTEARIWFDLGLSIYRLYLMDLGNEKK